MVVGMSPCQGVLCALVTALTMSGSAVIADEGGHTSGEAGRLETLALEARLALNSGDLAYSVTREQHGKLRHKRIYQVRFDGDKIRNDVQMALPRTFPGGASSGDPADLYKFVFTATECIFQTEVLNDGQRITPILARLGTPEGERTLESQVVYRVDPRKIGIVVEDIASLHDNPLDEILTSADRMNITLTTVELEGRFVQRVDYERQSGQHVSILIDPSQGHSVVRASIKDSTDEPPNHEERISCVVEEFQPGIWYPRMVDYEDVRSGKVGDRAILRVDQATFNERIDPAIFTLAGMNIPVGVHVQEEPPWEGRRMRIWDGKELVSPSPLADVPSGPSGPPVGQGPSHRRVWFALSTLLAVVALALVAFWRRLRVVQR